MTAQQRMIRHRSLVTGIACVLGLLIVTTAHAQTSTNSAHTAKNTSDTSTRQQALEARVNELQQELEQLKSEIQAQRVATEQASTQAAQATAAAQQVAKVQRTTAAPAKPAFSSAPGIKVALHGFIDVTAFHQNQSFTFGNGQNAELPVPGAQGSLSGVDVRNTRFWLDFSGAQFGDGWTGGGRIEMDFFGGFNGTGAFSQQQETPRLRQAYLDLDNAQTGTQIRVGQQWDLMAMLDTLPVSLTHVAFPLGFASGGWLGWRYPGVVVTQDLNHGASGAKWQLSLGAFEGNWAGPGNNVNFLTAGNPGFKPQLEAKLKVVDKDLNLTAYVAAHWSKIDLRGVGDTAPTPVESTFNSTGGEVGVAWKPGTWLVQSAAYTGRGLGIFFGDLAQFGDIKDTGGFFQIGDHFTPNWGAYVFYGASKPKTSDVIEWTGHGATGLLRSRQSALDLIYNSGPYEIGLEWMYDKLDTTTTGADRKTSSGNQLSLSAMYHF